MLDRYAGHVPAEYGEAVFGLRGRGRAISGHNKTRGRLPRCQRAPVHLGAVVPRFIDPPAVAPLHNNIAHPVVARGEWLHRPPSPMVATKASNVCRASRRTMVDWRTGGRRKIVTPGQPAG